MLSNNQLKFLKSLHQRKFRQKYGIFIAEGVKTASEVLQSNRFEIEGVYALRNWLDKNAEIVQELQNRVFEVSPHELSKISLLSTPNQILITLKNNETIFSKGEIEKDLSLYLDEIRDPGNMGTILRIADWFGIKWIFCSSGCVEIENPKVVQASMGAFLRVKTLPISLLELRQQMPDISVLGTSIKGEPLFEMKNCLPAIVVVGNESTGISEETAACLTKRISIPRHENGGAESLNAAIATGIVCSWFRNM